MCPTAFAYGFIWWRRQFGEAALEHESIFRIIVAMWAILAVFAQFCKGNAWLVFLLLQKA
jgi:hypothetical protein